jgi:hypothetical protein
VIADFEMNILGDVMIGCRLAFVAQLCMIGKVVVDCSKKLKLGMESGKKQQESNENSLENRRGS